MWITISTIFIERPEWLSSNFHLKFEGVLEIGLCVLVQSPSYSEDVIVKDFLRESKLLGRTM